MDPEEFEQEEGCCPFDKAVTNVPIGYDLKIFFPPGTTYHDMVHGFWKSIIRTMLIHSDAWDNVPPLALDEIEQLEIPDEHLLRVLQENAVRQAAAIREMQGLEVHHSCFDEARSLDADERMKAFEPSPVPDSLEAWCGKGSSKESDQ